MNSALQYYEQKYITMYVGVCVVQIIDPLVNNTVDPSNIKY